MWLLSPGQPSVTSRLAAGTLHGAVLSFSAELPFHLPAVQHRWLAYVLKMNFKIVKRICLHVMESSFNINIYIYIFEAEFVCRGADRLRSLPDSMSQQDGSGGPLGVLLALKLALSAVWIFCYLSCVSLKGLQEEGQWVIRVFWEYHYVALPNAGALYGGWCLD